MAAPASLLADGEKAVHRPRDGAAHEQQVPLGIHLHDLEAELREAPRTHVARHPLALDDPGRIGPRGDGAGLPVPGVAAGSRAWCIAIISAAAPRPTATPGTGSCAACGAPSRGPPAWRVRAAPS